MTTNGAVHENGSTSSINPMRFKDKVVLITGSTSGIGQSTLLMFAGEGAKVIIHGNTQKHIDETIELLRKDKIPEEHFHAIKGPLDEDSFVKRLVDETVEKFGRLDVVVCNAGVASIYGDEDFFSMKCLRYILDINVVSAINLVQLAMPHLTKTKGNVILISSTMGNRSTFLGHFYSVSKAALDHYARNAGMLYGAVGVRVNSLRVGVTNTRMYERVEKPDLTSLFIQQCVKSTAVNRMAEPFEIAQFVLFVASDQARYITASALDIDGGLASNAVQAPDNLFEHMTNLGPQSHGIKLPE